jgi:hypothetical protein
MADYLLEWEAHIDERKRPEGFPKSVFIREQYGNVDDSQLKELYNTRVKTIVTNPGIVVFTEDEPIDATKLNFDQRVYIPWHMITHFHGRVKLVTPAPVPETPLESLAPQDPVVEKEKVVIQ